MTTPGSPGRKTVLVALDGSPAAATALPIAASIADQLTADLKVLYVRTDERPVGDLRQWLQMPSDRADIDIRTLAGAPPAGILRATADPAVTLVVMTTHGRTVRSDHRLGSVAARGIAEVTCPVLLVNPEVAAHPPRRARYLRRLLFPLDGTLTTAAALSPATRLASDLGASIDLLYIASQGQIPPTEPGSMGAPHYLDQPQYDWPAWEREIVDRLCTLSARCPPDVPGNCWVLPAVCDSVPAGGDRWSACAGGANCLDICAAIRTEQPYARAGRCPPP